MNLLRFREHIDTEFKDKYAQVLAVKALKTDSEKDSLKYFLNMESAKSCDYIRFKGHKKLWMIECSDIGAQNENLSSIIQLLKGKICSVDPKLNKKCNKSEIRTITKAFKPEAVIHNEFRQKCIETTLLVHKITDKLNISFAEKFDKKHFVILVKKMDHTNVLFYDALRIKLKSGLKGIVDDVAIWSPEALANKLKN